MDLEKFKQQQKDLPVGLTDELKKSAEELNAAALKNQRDWTEKDRDLKLAIAADRKIKQDCLAREILVASLTGRAETFSTPKIDSLIAQANYIASTFLRLTYEK